jgi:hypothetical protein
MSVPCYAQPALVVLLTSMLAACDSEDEQVVERSALPPEVQSTLAREGASATIRQVTMETDDGVTYYEAETVANGHTRDVLIDSGGVVVEIEEEVSLESLPTVIRTKITDAAGNRRINRAESMTKDGRIVGYEIDVGRGLRRDEIEITVD